MYEVSDDPITIHLLYISPASLLTFRESPNLPSLENFTDHDLLSYGKRRWSLFQYLTDQFWSRLRDNFIHTLQRRHKWRNRKQCIGEDDVVLITDRNAERNQWPLARVKSISIDEKTDSFSWLLSRSLPGEPLRRAISPGAFMISCCWCPREHTAPIVNRNSFLLS